MYLTAAIAVYLCYLLLVVVVTLAGFTIWEFFRPQVVLRRKWWWLFGVATIYTILYWGALLLIAF